MKNEPEEGSRARGLGESVSQ